MSPGSSLLRAPEKFGVPEADRVATTLDPVIEGYFSEGVEANAKGVTQVAPFVRPAPAEARRFLRSKG
jgi:hypothetical protein